MGLGQNHPTVEALNLAASMYKHQEGVAERGHNRRGYAVELQH